MADVHGYCDERFRPMEDAFRGFLRNGVDKGATLAVTRHGEPVVDLWGGTRDYQQGTRFLDVSRPVSGATPSSRFRPACFLLR